MKKLAAVALGLSVMLSGCVAYDAPYNDGVAYGGGGGYYPTGSVYISAGSYHPVYRGRDHRHAHRDQDRHHVRERRDGRKHRDHDRDDRRGHDRSREERRRH